MVKYCILIVKLQTFECDYVFGEANSECLNTTTIYTEEACRVAADFLGAKFIRSGNYPVPFGCIADLHDGERLWFNSAKGSSIVKHRRPVCEICGSSQNFSVLISSNHNDVTLSDHVYTSATALPCLDATISPIEDKQGKSIHELPDLLFRPEKENE